MSFSLNTCPNCHSELIWNGEKVRYECSKEGCRWSSPFVYDLKMREKERDIKRRY